MGEKDFDEKEEEVVKVVESAVQEMERAAHRRCVC
ncbi:hypothetical protein SAMN05421754_1002137 [Nitrosomonas sp. Nm58]|nr:hypothetical protein SAMN05421754_1002137 [Nitrosomonas sp. Nm58]